MSATNVNRDPKTVTVWYQIHKFKADQEMIKTLLTQLCELVNAYHNFSIVTDAQLKGDWWYVQIILPREWTIKHEDFWGNFRKAMEKLAQPPPYLLNQN